MKRQVITRLEYHAVVNSLEFSVIKFTFLFFMNVVDLGDNLVDRKEVTPFKK